jgi:hypothetical protein
MHVLVRPFSKHYVVARMKPWVINCIRNSDWINQHKTPSKPFSFFPRWTFSLWKLVIAISDCARGVSLLSSYEVRWAVIRRRP